MSFVSDARQNIWAFWLKNIVEWKDHLMHLLYPEFCVCCQEELSRFEKACCQLCISELKYTCFEQLDGETDLDRLFWGRIPLEKTYALLYFEQDSTTQQIIHAIKYQGKFDLAKMMGDMIAKRLLDKRASLMEIDAIVPVPLHPRKRFLRGYNQSEYLARGLGERLGIPVRPELLKRKEHAKSQTKVSRLMRWENIERAFVPHQDVLQVNHLILIDDVVTTGSTIEACVRELQKLNPKLKVSVYSLAVTK
ncbi:MAG: ComF family protein [Bacteroidetes bacterium]|nr:MAG: ComF family protein [Bacteroidota bacterium]